MGASIEFDDFAYHPDEVHYLYEDRDGTPLYRECRWVSADGKKHIGPQKWDKDRGDWGDKNLKGIKQVLYNLPEVMFAAQAGGDVYLCEGEKNCDDLTGLGLVATTNSSGASAWHDRYAKDLVGARVHLLLDNDDPGFNRAVKVRNSLVSFDIDLVEILRVNSGHKSDGGDDVSDLLDQGGHIRDMIECSKEIDDWAVSTQKKLMRSGSIDGGKTLDVSGRDWAEWAFKQRKTKKLHRNEMFMDLVQQMRDNKVSEEDAKEWCRKTYRKLVDLGDGEDFTTDEVNIVFNKHFHTEPRDPWTDGLDKEEDSLPEDLPEGYATPERYRYKDGAIQENKGTSWINICDDAVWIVARSINRDGETFWTVRWCVGGETKEVTRDRGEFVNTSKIIGLATYDFPVYGGRSGNTAPLVKYMHELGRRNFKVLPMQTLLEFVGWQEDGTFKYREEDGVWAPDLVSTSQRYVGNGSFDEWKKILQAWGEDDRYMIMVLGSMASCLLDVVGCSAFTLDCYGWTGTGKSLGMQLSSSVWGKPDAWGRGGIIQSWQGTAFSINQKGSRYLGVPIFRDDTKSHRHESDISQTLYTVAEGQTRERGSQSGDVIEAKPWRSLLVSTGEKPATSFGSDPGGYGRVLPVHFDSPIITPPDWTEQELHDSLQQHYGWLGVALIKRLSNMNKDDRGKLKKDWDEYTKQALADSGGDAIARRRSRYVALLMLSSDLIERTVPRWREMLISRHGYRWLLSSGDVEEDLAYKAVRVLWDTANATKVTKWWDISDHEQRPEVGATLYGRWDKSSEGMPMYIQGMAEEILDRNGIAWDEVKRELGSRGWIRRDSSGQYTVSYNIRGDNSRLIILMPSVREMFYG